MSQFSIPWVQKNPTHLRAYRNKAITGLLSAGLALCLLGLLMFWAFDLGNPDRMTDWRVAAVFLLFLGPLATGLALMAGGTAVVLYRKIGALLRWSYVSFAIFLGAIIGTCALVWLHALAFRFMEDACGASARYLTAADIYSHLSDSGFGVTLLAYLLWPLQFEFVRDLVALGGIVGFISLIPGFGIWWERKVAGRVQSRLGPMRVGGWHGWAQSPADGIKLLFKEDFIPPEGDPILFRMAPYLTLVPPICAFIALPFAGAYVFRNLDVALLFILAMLGIEVIGVIIAGWASNNKWSVYGAMREACQMVSYEIPMGMSLLIPVMTVGSLQLTRIADAQAGGFADWLIFANPWCFAAFFIYFTASLASCKRAPFDLPESESELVAGFLTEYSGFRWSLFFFGEYAAMFVVAGLATILFLGGWNSPLPASWAPGTGGTFWGGVLNDIIRGIFFDGPILFVIKSAFMFYVQLWVRWTLPRIRIDQVLYACIQVLLPMTMVILLGNTFWILGVKHLQWSWLITLDAVSHWILVAMGAFLVIGMLGISAYGYVNRKRLPGPLVIDHLPGA